MMTIGHRKFENRPIFFLDELAVKEGTNRGMENDTRIPQTLRGSRLTIGQKRGSRTNSFNPPFDSFDRLRNSLWSEIEITR